MTIPLPTGCFVSRYEYEQVYDTIKKNAKLPYSKVITDVGAEWHSNEGGNFSKFCGCEGDVTMTVEINSNGDLFFEFELAEADS